MISVSQIITAYYYHVTDNILSLTVLLIHTWIPSITHGEYEFLGIGAGVTHDGQENET